MNNVLILVIYIIFFVVSFGGGRGQVGTRYEDAEFFEWAFLSGFTLDFICFLNAIGFNIDCKWLKYLGKTRQQIHSSNVSLE